MNKFRIMFYDSLELCFTTYSLIKRLPIEVKIFDMKFLLCFYDIMV